MRWKLRSFNIAISDCGRYFVQRIDVFGDRMYDAYYRAPGAMVLTEVGHTFGAAETARVACEAHARARAAC